MAIENGPGMRIVRLLLFTMVAIIIHPTGQTLAQEQAKIEAGEAIFNDYCATCHGQNLVSSGQTFDLRRLTANDRGRFQNSVLLGKNQMPPWKGVLGDEQIDQLWHYIRNNTYEK
jgi:mono/diheme cytochrome c family protein